MHIVVTIILPVFGILVAAYAVSRAGLFSVQSASALSNFVFNFALPVMLFRTLSATAMPEHFAWGLIFSYYGGVVTVFALAMIVGGVLFGRKLDGQGVLGMTAGYANLVLIGIPLILTALGEKGAVPLFLLVGLNSMVLYSLATIVIETGRGSGQGLKRLPINVARGLVTNPIVMSMILGFICGLLGWRLPAPVDTLFKTFGTAAAPCALFAMGATLAQYRIAGNIAESLALVALKLVVHPLVVFLLATYVFELEPIPRLVAVVLAGMPSGVNSFLFANRYETGVATATTSIFLSTGLSMISSTIILALFSVG
ncbi:MAG: AEC family transporter [Candidatus Eiseniibacteriota bacterium]